MSSMNNANFVGWIRNSGQNDAELCHEITVRVTKKLERGEYTQNDLLYIQKLKFAFSNLNQVSDKKLEKIRDLCKHWDIDIRHIGISSHRRFIGPIIVAIKKLLFPLLKTLLRDTLRQQRNFNAAVISYLVENE